MEGQEATAATTPAPAATAEDRGQRLRPVRLPDRVEAALHEEEWTDRVPPSEDLGDQSSSRLLAATLGIERNPGSRGKSADSGVGDPQDRKLTSEFLEIAVGGDKCGSLLHGESGRQAIYVGDLVKCLKLSRLNRVSQIDSDNANWKLREIVQSLSRGLFSMPLPGEIENLSPVRDRHQQRSSQPVSFPYQLLDTTGSWPGSQEAEHRAGIEDVGPVHRPSLSGLSRSGVRVPDPPPANAGL